jgi:hypothetical protein
MDELEKQALLTKTLDRIRTSRLKSHDYFIQLANRAAAIQGAESVFQRINERDDDTALDHLMEIKYGMLFKQLGFLTRFEPTGSKGPDLMVERDGVLAFVEVKRYRPKEGEHIPESDGPYATLQQYGDPLNTQLRIEHDLMSKLRQIEPRNGVEHGILAVWCDREFFEDLEFECAVYQISPEATEKGLRFCIFGSNYVNLGRQQRFYCEPTDLSCLVVGLQATFRSWMDDLRRAS